MRPVQEDLSRISDQRFSGGFGGVATTQNGRMAGRMKPTVRLCKAPMGLEGGQAIGMSDNETKLAYQGLPEALELGATGPDGDRCQEPDALWSQARVPRNSCRRITSKSSRAAVASSVHRGSASRVGCSNSGCRPLACRLVNSIHLYRIARLLSASGSLNDWQRPKTNGAGQRTGEDAHLSGHPPRSSVGTCPR